MPKTGADRPWTVKGGRPSEEAVVRACLVLLGRPPVIPADVRAAMGRDEAAAAPARVPKSKTA